MSTLTHRDRPHFAEVLDWLDGPLAAFRPAGTHPMRVEHYQAGHDYVIRAELPGVDPERDIEVTTSQGIITIRAERHEEQSARRYSEFRYGTYSRSIALPVTADEERIRALYSHGVLEVTVELTDDPKQGRRRIHVMEDHHIDPT